MATGKKYYWIKLKTSFLTSEKVDYLLSQKGGANYVVIYQMLCLKTINTDGELATQIGEVLIPYNAEKIQRDLKHFDIDTIRVALELYRNLGMIYEQENGVIKISEFNELIGSETDYAKQKRLQRKGVDNGVDNVHIEYRDRDIENKSIEYRDLSSSWLEAGYSQDLINQVNTICEELQFKELTSSIYKDIIQICENDEIANKLDYTYVKAHKKGWLNDTN